MEVPRQVNATGRRRPTGARGLVVVLVDGVGHRGGALK